MNKLVPLLSLLFLIACGTQDQADTNEDSAKLALKNEGSV